jgi:hypothetical protein
MPSSGATVAHMPLPVNILANRVRNIKLSNIKTRETLERIALPIMTVRPRTRNGKITKVLTAIGLRSRSEEKKSKEEKGNQPPRVNLTAE